MGLLKEKRKKVLGSCVDACRDDLKQYFHTKNLILIKRFEIIYKIFNLNDYLVASEVRIDRTTMNRYRRGVFIPTTEMKMRIAQAIAKLGGHPVDSSVIWGDDLFFEDWRENKNEA